MNAVNSSTIEQGLAIVCDYKRHSLIELTYQSMKITNINLMRIHVAVITLSFVFLHIFFFKVIGRYRDKNRIFSSGCEKTNNESYK